MINEKHIQALSDCRWAWIDNIFTNEEINDIKNWINELSLDKAKTVKASSNYRGDFTKWLEHNSSHLEQLILSKLDNIKEYLNKNLYLGLTGFESQVAHYPINTKYSRHFDSTKKNNKRVISLVTYLNSEWSEKDGGYLRLYLGKATENTIDIRPSAPTSVMFVSEEIEHEVLTTTKDRYSIATWFTRNQTI